MPAEFIQALMGQNKDVLPLGAWVNDGVKLLLGRGAGLFDAVGHVVETFASHVEGAFLALPFWLVMLVVVAVGTWRLKWRFGVFAFASLMVIRLTGFWDQTMVTLALVFSATLMAATVDSIT